MYEACGRIVNPIYGSVAMFSSGKWHLCQEAVEAILNGRPIALSLSDDSKNPRPGSAHKALCYDIRHVSNRRKSSRRDPFHRSGKHVNTELSALQSSVDEDGDEHWRRLSREPVRGKENPGNSEIASDSMRYLATEGQKEIELKLKLGWHMADSLFLGSS
ncbi:LOB domain-containing protein 37-like [Wolffia australiana]